MAVSPAALPSVPSNNSVPKIVSSPPCRIKIKVSFNVRNPDASHFLKFTRRNPTRLNAGLSEIEQDLIEDKRDRWATNGVSAEDFIYGEYDGHHTYYEGHAKRTFWETATEEYLAAEPPMGFQGLISWLFPPAIALGFVYHVPGEYLYIGAAVFVAIFCMIEIGKPDYPHNFEPQIYNMERKARDKLIADYNTMDIWDFNEKYGDLWDFTIKKDDVLER